MLEELEDAMKAFVFQSSIAPKSDRNLGADVSFPKCKTVPILDRPEERPQ